MKKFLLFLFAALGALSMSAQTNLLENASFENWTDGKPDHWTTASSAGNATLTQSDDAHTGSSAVHLLMTSSKNKRLGYQETILKAGTYTFTFWAYRVPCASRASAASPRAASSLWSCARGRNT